MVVDILFLVAALACAVHGARGGASVHVTGVLAVVGGAALAVPLARLVLMVMGAAGEAAAAGGLRMFVGCFGALWLGIHAIGLVVRSRTHRAAAGTSDRVLGGAVGLAHGALTALAVSGVLLVFVPSLRAAIVERPAGRLAERGVAFVDDHVSPKAQSPRPSVSGDLLQTSASTQ
ncbi:MAG: CvpA family protein [Planctomycetota bacterium]